MKKINESQEIALILKHISDLSKEMGLTFNKECRPSLSISNTLNLTKAKANRYIETIENQMETLNLRLETSRIDMGKWELNALAYQILLYSIVDYVNDRKELGWKLTKNFKVR